MGELSQAEKDVNEVVENSVDGRDLLIQETFYISMPGIMALLIERLDTLNRTMAGIEQNTRKVVKF